jgi:hypothetical protein
MLPLPAVTMPVVTVKPQPAAGILPYPGPGGIVAGVLVRPRADDAVGYLRAGVVDLPLFLDAEFLPGVLHALNDRKREPFHQRPDMIC